MSSDFPFIPYQTPEYDEKEMFRRAESNYSEMNSRRSVREFSSKDVPLELMQKLIMTASTAPSGAHKQPWTFCLVGNKELKRKIREAAEKEEYENYHGRMSEEWLEDLAPLETDWKKDFLENAPWLVIIFKQSYGLDEKGNRKKHYYVNESVGLAAGFFLAAVHHAGLASLTHTPSPMNFLSEILNRPENEKPYLLIPVGYAAEDCRVPDLERKNADEIIEKYL